MKLQNSRRWIQIEELRDAAARSASAHRLLRMHIRRRAAHRNLDPSADRLQPRYRPRRGRVQSQRMHPSLVQERCRVPASRSIVQVRTRCARIQRAKRTRDFRRVPCNDSSTLQLHLYKGVGRTRLLHSGLTRRRWTIIRTDAAYVEILCQLYLISAGEEFDRSHRRRETMLYLMVNTCCVVTNFIYHSRSLYHELK